MLSDGVSTYRDVGIKVLGVDGRKLPGHDGATQAFVFATARRSRIIDEMTDTDTGSDPDGFRHAVVDRLLQKGAEFELRVQLCTDLEATPVESASVPWPEDQIPYVAVARITIPPQDAYSPARREYFDQILSFQPAHSLAAHRPLGSLVRAEYLPGAFDIPPRHEPATPGRTHRTGTGAELSPDGRGDHP